MKLEPIANPSQPQINNAKAEIVAGSMSPRERAIAKLMGTQPNAQAEAVSNPSQVSPEEMGAISSKSSTSQPSEVQKTISESSESSEQPSAETKASEEPISSQYAVLARKEKAIRQREQQLKTREAAIKAAEDASKVAAAPKAPEFDPSKYVPKDRLSQDPFTVLNELGLTYDQLTEMALNAPRPEQLALMNEMKALKDEMNALKGETKKSFEDQQNLQRQQAIKQIENQAKALINNDPAYETIKATDSISDVIELIEKTFDQDGILMTVEEAAQEVENYLIEEAIKLAKLSKIQQRLQPKPTTPVEKPAVKPEQPQMKTLTNQISSSRPLSAKERAILAFQGKLQK